MLNFTTDLLHVTNFEFGRYFEIEEDGSFRENCTETLEEPIKGICLSPKSVLDVMNGEVHPYITLKF